jgi:hypothetical protein
MPAGGRLMRIRAWGHPETAARGERRIGAARTRGLVCGLGGCNFSRAVQVLLEKTCGGPLDPTAHTTGDFLSRVAMRLDSAFSSPSSRVDFRHPQFFGFCNSIGQ